MISKKTDEIKLNNGISIPKLAVDTSNVQTVEDQAILRQVIKSGFAHIDVSQVAYNTPLVAQVIREFPRSSLFITYKVWVSNYRNFVKKSLNQFLQMINSNYIDLISLHFPYSHEIEVTANAFMTMYSLYNDKIARAVGVCNFSSYDLENLRKRTGLMPHVNQFFITFLNQNKSLINYMDEKQIVGFGYSTPLTFPSIVFPNYEISSRLISRVKKSLDKVIKTESKSYEQIQSRWVLENHQGLLIFFRTEVDIDKYSEILNFVLQRASSRKISHINFFEKKIKDGSINDHIRILSADFRNGLLLKMQ